MWARVAGLFSSSSSSYQGITEESPRRSGGLFTSANEDSLLARARASKDGKDAFALAEFYLRKEFDSHYVRGTAWLVMAIALGCTEAETLFLKDKWLMPSESIACGGDPRKSNALSRCAFLALLLLDKQFSNLESSGWLKSWKVDNQPKFTRFNRAESQKFLKEAIKANDKDAEFLLSKLDESQVSIFNEFFSYCINNNLLNENVAPTLKVNYTRPQAVMHKESTSLLGAGSTSRRSYS